MAFTRKTLLKAVMLGTLITIVVAGVAWQAKEPIVGAHRSDPAVRAYLFQPIWIESLDMPSDDNNLELSYPVEDSSHKYFRTNPIAMAEGRYVGDQYYHETLDIYCAWVLGNPGETVILKWPEYIWDEPTGRYASRTIVGYVTQRQFSDADGDRRYFDDLPDDEFLIEIDQWWFSNLPQGANCSPLLSE